MMPFNSEKGAVAIRRLQNKADPAINNRVKVSTAISKQGLEITGFDTSPVLGLIPIYQYVPKPLTTLD